MVGSGESRARQQPARGLSPRVSPLFPETSGGHVSSGKGALGSPGAGPRAEPARPAQHTLQGSTASLPRGPRTDPHAERTHGARAFLASSSVDTLTGHLPWERRGTTRGSHPTRMRWERKAGASRLHCPPDGQHIQNLPSRLQPSTPSGPFLPLATAPPQASAVSSLAPAHYQDHHPLQWGRESPSRQVFADEFLPLPPALRRHVPGTRA